MKAVKKFKSLIDQKRPAAFSETLGKGIRTLHATDGSDATSEPPLPKSRSVDVHDRRMVETALATEGVHHDIDTLGAENSRPGMTNKMESNVTMFHVLTRQDSEDHHHHKGKKLDSEHLAGHLGLHNQNSGEKGHAHDPLDETPLFLGIGSGGEGSLDVAPQEVVAESPTAAEFNIYDTAYQEEVERIRAAQGRMATVYLNRRVDSKEEYKSDENMVDAPKSSEAKGAHEGFKGLLDRAREQQQKITFADGKVGATGRTFSEIAAKATENTKAVGKDIGDRGGLRLEKVMQMALQKSKEATNENDQ
jgi:[calcium/calmodulin-dependent protein kinase] kinase